MSGAIRSTDMASMSAKHKRPDIERATWLRERSNWAGVSCLIWPFSKCRGYGNLKYQGKIRRAHRVMCEMVNGKPPSDRHEAAHSCGNRACVNPHHLSWKTRAENQADTIAQGKAYSNAGKTRDKLTRAQALKIRSMRGAYSQGEIAAEYGVSYSTVAKIHRGEIWK